MNNVAKKLSLAIYWHMHQPVYELDGVFYMPWTRLHAIKDYLDMVSILEKFPKLKLNFDVVPSLVDDIIHYTENGFNDIHSSISLTPTEELTDNEKEYIINNFFNMKYETMVYKYPKYRELFKKRFYHDGIHINDYTNQEYSDLIALFNLSWIDPSHIDMYPAVQELIEKGENYTLEDRTKILAIHLKIMKDIIPTYKKYIEEGRIELTTSPYYHAILPILCDYETTTYMLANSEHIPLNCNLEEDAHNQIKLALDRMEEVFGKRPRGVWASEYCLTDKVLKLLQEEKVNWTISDETILSKSINFEFVRDFKGNLEDPYYLLKTYSYPVNNSEINIIFRDSLLPNLINFEYSNADLKVAVSDFYNKIKSIQNKLLVSPDDNHLLTIALDGENCWESYINDGNDFLEGIYSKITSDDSIETTLISDYILADRNKKVLTKIHPGSWINKNFNFWIGEPVKNLAWNYLNNVRNEILELLKEQPEKKLEVMQEIYIAEGSDWFWWYGEPNNSGQDNIFDFLFREHLKNTYKILGVNPPEFLETSIIETINRENQTNSFNQHSGSNVTLRKINIADGPVFKENKIFSSISYGYDNDNVYFEFALNPKEEDTDSKSKQIHQFCVYFRTPDRLQKYASIRVSHKTDIIFPILKEQYHNELSITLYDNKLFPSYLSEATADNVWKLVDSDDVTIEFDGTLNVTIPFDDLDIKSDENLEFFFILANSGLRSAFIPKDYLIKIKRP